MISIKLFQIPAKLLGIYLESLPFGARIKLLNAVECILRISQRMISGVEPRVILDKLSLHFLHTLVMLHNHISI